MNTDRAQLAALDADGMHNTQRIKYEYGEFDTVKDQQTLNQEYQERRLNEHNKSLFEKAWVGNMSAPSIIQTRSETHGDFTINSHVSQAIKRAVRAHGKYQDLHDYQREAIDAIAGKIGRIVAGDADFSDHWVDIAGYAELVRERLKK